MSKHLLHDIQSRVKLTAEELELLPTFWKEKRLSKNEYLVRNDEL